MAGTTSLLKSAASAKKKIQAQEDALVAFNWENSAQTYDDYVEYSKYISDRQSKTSDASQALSYEKTLRSARRSYTSNELQRQQMAIMEGRATTADKLGSIKDLFYQANENGDYNLAQNLLSQWDSLSIKLQNEQETAARAFSASSAKVKDKFMSSLENGLDDITLPSGEKVTPLAVIRKDLEETGGTVESWMAAEQTLEAMKAAVLDQYNNATTQDEVDALELKYGRPDEDGTWTSLDKKLKFDIGGKSLTAQQVTNAVANEAINNPIYGLKAIRNEETGNLEYKLEENKIARFDYVRKIDPNTGEEYFDAVRDAQGRPTTIAKATAIRTAQDKVFTGVNQGEELSLNTQITNDGQVIGSEKSQNLLGRALNKKEGLVNAGADIATRNDTQTIGNRLLGLGIQASGSATSLEIKLPGENVARQARIEGGNAIRYIGDDGQLYEIGLVDRNLGQDYDPNLSPEENAKYVRDIKAGVPRAVSYEEVSDFGSKSKFGGQLSQASAQGNRYMNDIAGRVASPSAVLAGPIRTGNDFSGFGTNVGSAGLQGSSAILQTASNTRAQIQLQQQKQQMLQAQAQAAQLQATNTFNLNQTPVQQLTSTGVLKKQLQVAAPQAQPRVVVAPPAPTPRITGVSVATPGRISGVSTAPSSGRLTVR